MAVTLAGSGAMAQPSEDPVDGPWSGTAEVSLVATSGNSDTRTFGLGGEDEVAVTAALSARLSLKVSHRLSYLNRPVPGFRKTDTTLSAAMVASF
jgi:putative salt-induced outer membrane protein YdiY